MTIYGERVYYTTVIIMKILSHTENSGAGQIDFELVAQRLQFDACIHDVVVFVFQVFNHFLDDVFHRDQAGNTAVLVDGQCKRTLVFTKTVEQLVRGFGFRNEVGFSQQFAKAAVVVFERLGINAEQVTRMEYAEILSSRCLP